MLRELVPQRVLMENGTGYCCLRWCSRFCWRSCCHAMVEVPVADRRDFAMVAFVFVRLRVLFRSKKKSYITNFHLLKCLSVERTGDPIRFLTALRPGSVNTVTMAIFLVSSLEHYHRFRSSAHTKSLRFLYCPRALSANSKLPSVSEFAGILYSHSTFSSF